MISAALRQSSIVALENFCHRPCVPPAAQPSAMASFSSSRAETSAPYSSSSLAAPA